MTAMGWMNSFVRGSLLLSSVAAFAGVNVNNGNFYVAYTDMYIPTAGLGIEMTRTYNSRSNYVKGSFGVGWSSEIEGRVAMDKGAVNYFEGGGGNIVRFTPTKQAGVYENGLFGLQTMRQTKDGFVLSAANGKDLSFANDGHLVRVSDRNKNYIEYVYTQGQLSMIRDNFNNQIKVKWGTFGNQPRIVALEMGDQKARFEYSAAGNLVKAAGADGVPYDYAYDDEHNMTRISYQDGTYKQMAYNKARDWVSRFRDRDGMTTSYDYYSDKLDPENKFGTTVTRMKEGTTDAETSKFWYEFRRRADGSRYNYRAVTSVRGTATETIFTECCGTPLVVSQWKSDEVKAGDNASMQWTVAAADKKSTFFEYYPDGLLKKKTAADGGITMLSYDAKHKKVASVTRDGRRVDYNYDSRGNLAWAFDAQEARRMDLKYDLKGRITVIQEKSNVAKAAVRTVYFRYNALGKPVEIKEKAGAFQGSIRIGYSQNGEVTGIFNAEGRAVASESEVESARRVASTFQNLLEIVQPAGVSLTPEG